MKKTLVALVVGAALLVSGCSVRGDRAAPPGESATDASSTTASSTAPAAETTTPPTSTQPSAPTPAQAPAPRAAAPQVAAPTAPAEPASPAAPLPPPLPEITTTTLPWPTDAECRAEGQRAYDEFMGYFYEQNFSEMYDPAFVESLRLDYERDAWNLYNGAYAGCIEYGPYWFMTD